MAGGFNAIGSSMITRFASFAVCMAVGLSASRGRGADLDPRIDSYGRLSRFSPVEGAGSHGSTGFVLGAGLRESSVPVPQLLDGQTDKLDSQDPQEERLRWGEIIVTKGLYWPVDIGGGYARSNNTLLQRFSGYTQWTVYEALAMPALAVRGSYSRVFGFGGIMNSMGAQGLASYGFLRYFTIYGGYGIDLKSGTLDNPSPAEEQLSLSQNSEAKYSDHENWTEFSNFYGLRVLALPPTGTLSLEASTYGGEASAYVAKVAFGM